MINIKNQLNILTTWIFSSDYIYIYIYMENQLIFTTEKSVNFCVPPTPKNRETVNLISLFFDLLTNQLWRGIFNIILRFADDSYCEKFEELKPKTTYEIFSPLHGSKYIFNQLEPTFLFGFKHTWIL